MYVYLVWYHRWDRFLGYWETILEGIFATKEAAKKNIGTKDRTISRRMVKKIEGEIPCI